MRTGSLVLAFGSILLIGAGMALNRVSTAPAARTFAITGARVFDGDRVIERATVVVRDGRIAAVGPDVAVPSGTVVVDGSGHTLLPGLIDAHTHAWGDALSRALVFGVTTELDMFTAPQFMKAMHDEQAAGDITDRADLRSAGVLTTVPGGHGTEYGIPIPTLATAAQAQAFVDARIAEGSDYVKIILDDGSSYGMTIPTLTRDEVSAVVTAAHARGRLAIVHIGSQRGAVTAIAAGADGLAHLFEDSAPAPDFAARVAAHHAFVIPTLTVLESMAGAEGGTSLANDPRIAPFLTDTEIGGLTHTFRSGPRPTNASGSRLQFAYAREAVAQLKAASVPLLAGTDAPNPGTAHGASLHRELELLVSAGLTPPEALAAATSVPARIFGLTDRGRVAVGLRADLVLVDGDPTRDITATRAIAGVWRNGVRVERTPVDRTAMTAPAVDVPSDGLISDFDAGDARSTFGDGWTISTDRLMGGSSMATMDVTPDEEQGGCLTVAGSIGSGSMFPWAGAMFSPGSRPMAPANLSRFSTLIFRARGDGGTYRVLVFADRLGPIPAEQPFVAGAEWRDYSIPFKAFGTDGGDIKAILFSAGAGQPAFRFQLDRVALR
jgi:imidazolonepropionase-like amidohydrolase